MSRNLSPLAGLLVAGLLAACGQSGESDESGKAGTAASPTRPPSAATKKPAPTPQGDGALVPDNLATARDQLGQPGATPGSAQESKKGSTQGSTQRSTQGRRFYGADISWPQCPKGMGIPQKRTLGAPMPTQAARFVVIGLTNGPSFTPNPCLADQVRWARERNMLTAAYAVVSYPDRRTVAERGDTGPFGGGRLDRLRNVGHQAAGYTVREMRAAGLRSPIVWVDVEPVNDFDWSSDTRANAAVVQGTVRGYRDAGLRVGIYSTPHMYAQIVGGLRFGVPEWRAAGQTSQAEALRRCAPSWSIQGGRGVFGQWVEDDRDRNVTCPGVDLRFADYFDGP